MHELDLDAETMRQIGYAVVDRLVDWQSTLHDRPVWNGAGRSETESIVSDVLPQFGSGAAGFEHLLDHLLRDIVPRGARTDHPRFFAFVPGNATWPAVLGDFIAAGTNVFQGTWLASAGVSQIELRVLDWFKQWLGMPAASTGLLVSGGSVANLTALACARQHFFDGHDDRARLYLSAETHSSIARATRVLGFRTEQVRVVDVDSDQRIDMDALRHAIDADRGAGLKPFLVVGNAGTTSTGSVDPLPELRELCDTQSLWLHIDAAYGGFATLTQRGNALLEGIGSADSVTLDPHKWLYQPFEVGSLLLRDPAALRNAFHVMPDYLRDTAVGTDAAGPVNFAERGIQLTRYARAIKIWLSLNYFGLDAFRATIDRTLDLTAFAEQSIRGNDAFEVLTPARLGIVCFRRRVADVDAHRIDALNNTLVKRLMDSGLGMVSSTRVNGVYALRLCILTYRTTEEDVTRVLDWLATASVAGSELDRV